jgi:NAD(P)H-flavin reductase
VLLTRPIREIRNATPRARTVLIDLAGTPFPYLPGQAVLISANGTERRRPYSVAAAPEESVRDGSIELLISVDADGNPGGGLRLEPGTLIDIDGPLGTFTFPAQPSERRFLFIAGGTGIAPLRAMLHHALGVPHEAIGLLFSARTPAEFAYEQEFRSLAAARQIELELRVTREVAPDDWSGVRGRLGREDLAPLVHGGSTLCFVCGPPALVQEIPQILEELGVPRERVRTEEWT